MSIKGKKKKIKPKIPKICIRVGVPIVVGLICIAIPYLLNQKCTNPISSDGLLSYIGNIIGWLITFITLFITIVQAQKTFDQESQRLCDVRKAEICPRFFITLQKEDEGLFTLKIRNVGSYIAVGVLIFDTKIFSYIKPDEETSTRLSFKRNQENTIYIDQSNFDFTHDGYPKEIVLLFGDVDNNDIQQVFKCCVNSDNIYDPEKVEYL